MAKHIVVIPGDGIGGEVTDAAVRILKKIDEIYKIGLTYEWKDAGGTSYDKYGVPLTEDTVEACRKADAVLFGAVGGDQWDHLEPALRPEKPSWDCARSSACMSISGRSESRIPSSTIPR